MPLPTSDSIIASGQAFVLSDSGLICASCYVSHGLLCMLTYRFAPTWGFTPRVRWVETYSCPFCRHEIHSPEGRLPLSLLPLLVELSGRFYFRATGEPFLPHTPSVSTPPSPP